MMSNKKSMKKLLFDYEYLNKEHLAGLDNYKYSAIDNSPLSCYVTHPFWNKIVNYYPLWLAPNILTFSGFLCLILSFMLLSYYDYHFYGNCMNPDNCTNENQLKNYENFKLNTNMDFSQVNLYMCSCIPRFVWLIAAICQFLSHHLDGTDGKQARRTKSSSALGELFDHGLDSWATLFLPVTLYSMVGRSAYGASVLEIYFILWLIMFSFIISHWEKYNTGILFLPWSYDLAQISMTLALLATYIFGQEIWLADLKPVFPMKLVTFAQICVYVASLGLSIPFSIQNIYSAYISKQLKQSNVYESIRPLLSTIYLFFIQLVWIEYSKINILELEPRVFYWLTGTLFSNISCRLIVAQMTITRCEIFNWTLIPLTAIVSIICFTNIKRVYEIYLLYFIALLVTLSHIHYGICMVRQICRHLNIYCFVITRKPTNRDDKLAEKIKQ